jgi:carbon storage regulator
VLILTRRIGERILIGEKPNQKHVTVVATNAMRGSATLHASNLQHTKLLIDQELGLSAEITVKLIDVHGKQCRLGVSAPRSVAVHREEIAQRIAAQQLRSTR